MADGAPAAEAALVAFAEHHGLQLGGPRPESRRSLELVVDGGLEVRLLADASRVLVTADLGPVLPPGEAGLDTVARLLAAGYFGLGAGGGAFALEPSGEVTLSLSVAATGPDPEALDRAVATLVDAALGWRADLEAGRRELAGARPPAARRGGDEVRG